MKVLVLATWENGGCDRVSGLSTDDSAQTMADVVVDKMGCMYPDHLYVFFNGEDHPGWFAHYGLGKHYQA